MLKWVPSALWASVFTGKRLSLSSASDPWSDAQLKARRKAPSGHLEVVGEAAEEGEVGPGAPLLVFRVGVEATQAREGSRTTGRELSAVLADVTALGVKSSRPSFPTRREGPGAAGQAWVLINPNREARFRVYLSLCV